MRFLIPVGEVEIYQFKRPSGRKSIRYNCIPIDQLTIIINIIWFGVHWTIVSTQTIIQVGGINVELCANIFKYMIACN